MIALITPWREYGNVQQYLSKFASPDIDLDALVRLPPSQMYRPCLSAQVIQIYEAAQGLEYLHSVDIIHGDLRGVYTLLSLPSPRALADAQCAGEHPHRR